MILKENNTVYVISILIWLFAILFLQAIPEQADFHFISIGFPLAILSFLFLLWTKPTTNKFIWLLWVGIVARFMSIFFFPQLSDDIFRFIWDGRIIHHGMQPYAYLPMDIVEQIPSLGEGGILNKMNSPEYYTVYPPVSQVVFYCSSWLGLSIKISSILMKSIFFCFELVTLFFALKILDILKLPNNNILMYWLNPLILIEGMGNLHFEIIMIAFLAISIYFWRIDKPFLSVSFLAISVASKLLSVLVLPYFLWQTRWRKGIVILAFFVLSTLLLFSPLLLGFNYLEFLSSIDLYFRKFEFNAGIYYILRWLGIQFSGYNLIAFIGPALGLTFIFLMLWITVKNRMNNAIQFLYIVMLLYLLLATTVHPWYLSIPIFCTVFIRSRVALVWSCIIWLTYINYSQDGYMENLWIVTLEYLIILVYVIYELKFRGVAWTGEYDKRKSLVE